jgi:ethanolamine permease
VVAHTDSFGWQGVFAALPFAIWFYLAIEGVAMMAEEVKDPRRTIPRAYLLSIGTLVFLALGTMLLSAERATGAYCRRSINHCLKRWPWYWAGQSLDSFFRQLGLFGLIASFHCNTLGYSRKFMCSLVMAICLASWRRLTNGFARRTGHCWQGV